MTTHSLHPMPRWRRRFTGLGQTILDVLPYSLAVVAMSTVQLCLSTGPTGALLRRIAWLALIVASGTWCVAAWLWSFRRHHHDRITEWYWDPPLQPPYYDRDEIDRLFAEVWQRIEEDHAPAP